MYVVIQVLYDASVSKLLRAILKPNKNKLFELIIKKIHNNIFYLLGGEI